MSSYDLKKKAQALRQIEQAVTPDQEWVLRNRRSLMDVVSASTVQAKEEASWESTLRGYMQAILPLRMVAAVRAPMFALLSIFGVVLGGSVMGVSAAEQAIPGDLLYPVKLATEQTRLIFTKDKTERLKLKTEFVGRRAQEIKTIVATDVSKKQERLQEATEILKRDLDTVKTQLHEVSRQASPTEVVQAAKYLDEKSIELATVLKSVKPTIDQEARIKVTEVEVSAVNTGVRAVQALIDVHVNSSGTAEAPVSTDELVQAIQGKVQGLEENMVTVTEKLNQASTTMEMVSSTLMEVPGVHIDVASSSRLQIDNASTTLAETKQLIQENKFDELKLKLSEAAKTVGAVETVVEAMKVAPTSTEVELSPSVASTTLQTSPAKTVGTTTVISSTSSTSTLSGSGK